jgi:hypothetical protein
VSGAPISSYGLERLHIQFQALPYNVLDDADTAGNEWLRYVVKLSRPTSELISFNQGSLKFTAGPSFNAGNPDFLGSGGMVVGKTTKAWKWMLVANDYIFDLNDIGQKIEAGVGKCNATEWAGHDPGTLLLESVEYEPVMAPINPADLGLPPNSPPRLWNVIFNFKHFTPDVPPGTAKTYGNLGWLTAPDVADPNGYWYSFVTEPGGAFLYRSYEFADLWKAWDA